MELVVIWLRCLSLSKGEEPPNSRSRLDLGNCQSLSVAVPDLVDEIVRSLLPEDCAVADCARLLPIKPVQPKVWCLFGVQKSCPPVRNEATSEKPWCPTKLLSHLTLVRN